METTTQQPPPAPTPGGRFRTGIRWFGRVYVGLGAVGVVGAIAFLMFGHLGLAIRALGDALGFGLLGGTVVMASRLSWQPRNSADSMRARALARVAWRESRTLRLVFLLVVAVQVGAMGLVAVLVLRHR